jgi:hypothetical protein
VNSAAVAGQRRQLPPIELVSVVSMALAIVSAIYLAWHLPQRPSLAPSIVLLAIAGILLAADLVLLARVRDFAWQTFWTVGRWATLAYLVITGMLEYVFIYDHTRGASLALMTITLALFAVNVPLILAFSVARYQSPDR